MEGETITKEQFLLAASTLIARDSLIVAREQADKLLTHLYVRPEAWGITTNILQEEGKLEPGILLTTVKILRVKLFYYFSDLSRDEIPSLFAYLISKSILTQLA